MYRLLLLSLLLLSACAGEAVGPSLAKRPIESRDMSEPVREVATPGAAETVLQATIAGARTRAEEGQRAFAAQLPRARAASSSGPAEGSEAWVLAQQLLTALEAARAPATAALSELDALIAARLNGNDDAGLVELQAANAQVSAIVEAQQRDLDALRARLSR